MTPFTDLSFASEITGGKLVITEGRLALMSGVARLEGGADIAQRRLSARLRLPAIGEPEAPPAVIAFDGPLAAPKVTRDVRALAAYLDRRTASTEARPAAPGGAVAPAATR
jgi:hypothetical protein